MASRQREFLVHEILPLKRRLVGLDSRFTHDFLRILADWTAIVPRTVRRARGRGHSVSLSFSRISTLRSPAPALRSSANRGPAASRSAPTSPLQFVDSTSGSRLPASSGRRHSPRRRGAHASERIFPLFANVRLRTRWPSTMGCGRRPRAVNRGPPPWERRVQRIDLRAKLKSRDDM